MTDHFCKLLHLRKMYMTYMMKYIVQWSVDPCRQTLDQDPISLINGAVHTALRNVCSCFSLLGQRLLRKADFHLGQHINTFFRIRCKMTENFADKKHLQGAEKRHITMYGMYIRIWHIRLQCPYSSRLRRLQPHDYPDALARISNELSNSLVVEPKDSTLLIPEPNMDMTLSHSHPPDNLLLISSFLGSHTFLSPLFSSICNLFVWLK